MTPDAQIPVSQTPVSQTPFKFNLADVFETVADSVPERIALSYEAARSATPNSTGSPTGWHTCCATTVSVRQITSHCS